MKKNYLLWIVYVLMLVVTISGAMAVSTTDLVSYYKLDETSGTVTDSHGTNDGTNNGATTGVTGQINTAYYFDGSNDKVESTSTDFAFTKTASEPMTIAMWIYPTVGASDVQPYIIGVGPTTNYVNWGLSYVKSTNKLRFVASTTGSTYDIQIDSSFSITQNAWNFIVLTRTANGVYTWYHNDVSSQQFLTNTNNLVMDSNRLHIGTHYNGVVNYNFNGKIDEVAIFDVALSSTEVSDLYNSSNGLAYPFTTSPVVTTSAATSVTSVGATLNGDLTDLSGETSVDVSFRYREKDSVGAWTTTTPVAKTTTGTFNEAITGLSYNTEYEYQAVVEWGTTDEAFGALTYFTTLNPTVAQPSITTGTTYDSAYYKGTITIRSAITNFLSTECQYSINDGSSWLSADAISGFCEKTGLTPNANINIKFRARSGSTGAWVTSSTKSYTYDNTAPSSLSFSPNSRDWGNTDAVVMTSAVDSGSGLDKSSIEFCIILNSASCTPDNGLTGTPTFGSGNDIYEFTLSLDGERTICFNVADNLGTRSSTSCSGVYKIDKTSPTTSGAITSGSAITEGENAGVYFTDVVYTITPSDALSGVSSTQYCVDSTNACTPNTAYTTPITINTNGDHYVRFRSTDNAGNVQTTQSSGLIERDDTLVTFFSATLTDAYTSAGINNFCMNIRNPSTGTLLDSYCTTTGTITTTYEYAVENYNLSFYNIGGAGTQTHFDFSAIVSINENYAAEAAQAYLDLNVVELITGNTISAPYSFKISAVTYSDTDLPLAISAGEHTLEFLGGASYLDKNITFNISALENKLLDVELGNTLLKINLTDIVTTSLLEVTSYVTVNNNAGFEETYTSSNGELSAQLLQGNYSLTLWANDYAYRYENISINSSLFETSYSMYSNNSIWITAKDSLTNVDLTGFNIELYNTDRTYTSNDNDTGIIRLNDVESGIYTLKIIKTNYTTAEYVVTMTGGSHQSIIGYLLQSEATTTFTVVNSISNAIIEDAQISMFMNINGTWTLISSQNTDITGRAQFSYTSDVEYRFIVDATDYVQREFFLKPLFNTYTVRLTPELQSIPDDNIGKWVYEINNSGYFVYNENNAFSISISSGTGTIEYYTLNVTDHEGNAESVTCLIAIGCLNNFQINITNADANDRITVEYWIKETGRAEKYFRHVYSIQDIYNPNTLWGWKDTGENVGSLEKGFIAMIITIIIVGVASSVSVMVGAPPVTVSGFVLAATVEILALVGFIPSLAAHMIALGCILIVLFGRGEL